jgi:hypothetical protein
MSSSASSWAILEGLFEILALFSFVVALIFFIVGPFTINGVYVDSNTIANLLLLVAIVSTLQTLYFNTRKKQEK